MSRPLIKWQFQCTATSDRGASFSSERSTSMAEQTDAIQKIDVITLGAPSEFFVVGKSYKITIER